MHASYLRAPPATAETDLELHDWQPAKMMAKLWGRMLKVQGLPKDNPQ
jgi:hypothetical protein